MNSTNKTVLIIGGSAGIGLEIAKLLAEKNNRVLITGRNAQRLEQAAAFHKNIIPIVSDTSKESDVVALTARIQQEFSDLDIVINNAGNAFLYNLSTDTGAFAKAQDEMLTNYLAVIRVNESLLPLLKTRPAAAIVNVSSVVAFVPGSLATYSASKAALHSYTQSLRLALERSSDIKVFELMPPLVDTEFSAAIGGKNGMPAKAVAEEFIAGLESDNYEIHVGQTAQLYELFRSSPAEALQLLNGQRNEVLAEN